MDWSGHDISEWVASFVLTTIGYFTRLVFGDDKLTRGQLVLFYLFCGGITWITNTYIEPGIMRSSIQLVAGLVVINLIKGIIKGAKGSEKSIGDKVKDKINDILGGGHNDK
jgi:hypothetical protein